MKNRLNFYIAGGLALLGFIFGSIFDLQISATLYNSNFYFGRIISAFSLLLGYATLAFFAGALFNLGLRKNLQLGTKFVLFVLSIGCFIAATYYAGKEFFSVNGLDKPGTGYLILALGISAVLYLGVAFLGYKLTSKTNNTKLWIVILILCIAIALSLLPGTTLLKNIFHRPRFRTVVLNIEGITFHRWWEPFKNYKDFITNTITKEEFKSFPSGHAGASMVLTVGLSYLPTFLPKLKKYQTPLFWIAFIYSALISLSRIAVGAHFLSDVSMGSLLTLICFYIANEIIVRKKFLDENDEIKQEETPLETENNA